MSSSQRTSRTHYSLLHDRIRLEHRPCSRHRRRSTGAVSTFYHGSTGLFPDSCLKFGSCLGQMTEHSSSLLPMTRELHLFCFYYIRKSQLNPHKSLSPWRQRQMPKHVRVYSMFLAPRSSHYGCSASNQAYRLRTSPSSRSFSRLDAIFLSFPPRQSRKFRF